MSIRIPVIAIVGRPNVGKSSLFNRIVRKRKAIVEDVAGVTRDRIYALVEEYDIPFHLVDTGGIELNPVEEISKQVVKQSLCAIEDADVIICLLDGKVGVNPDDRDVVGITRSTKKPVLFVVNKCDGIELDMRAYEFYSLGCDEVLPISALHDRNVGDLVNRCLHALPNYEALRQSVASLREQRHLEEMRASEFIPEEFIREDEMYTDEDDDGEDGGDDEKMGDDSSAADDAEQLFAPVFLPDQDDGTWEEYRKTYSLQQGTKNQLYYNDEGDVISSSVSFGREATKEVIDEEDEVQLPEVVKLAIVGRPNVGKSTLLNTLTGANRAVVSDIAGTTRDSLDVRLRREGQEYLVVDTAGIRKQARVEAGLEHYSVLRSFGALSECDVAIVVLDAVAGVTEQDTKIIGIAHEQGKAIVLVVNKWDLVTKDHRTIYAYTEKVRQDLKFVPYAPLMFVSALSGKRCPRIIELARDIAKNRLRRVSSGKLNRILQAAFQKRSASYYRGFQLKMYYAAQVDVSPPRFVLFVNYPKGFHFSYLRYLKNSIREHFPFEGTDIKLVIKKRNSKKES